MRYIRKGLEPTSWKRHKATPNALYKGADTDDLRRSLIKEQGYLCGYCMRRIYHMSKTEADVDKSLRPVTTTRIEHIKCQTVNGKEDTSRSLDYGNMILCCNGEENMGVANHQCDVLKHDDSISFSPLSPNVTTLFSYTGDGRMKANSAIVQAEIGSDTDEKQKGILNLNGLNLKRGRKQVWDNLHAYLNKKGWTTQIYNQTIKEWSELDRDGMYREYSQVVIYYLEKKLKIK